METLENKKTAPRKLEIKRETHNYKTEQEWKALRIPDITSTDASVLLGVSTRSTKAELWHRKKEKAEAAFDANERSTWGNRLEWSIIQGAAEDNGWKVRAKKEYIRIPDRRLGSSFDGAIVNENGDDIALIEAKNVDSLIFRDNWIEDESGEIEASLEIEVQMQHQMMVSGIKENNLCALVGGNKLYTFKRQPNQKVMRRILDESAAFWESIKKNKPPAFDYVRDADLISSLYGYAEPGKVVDFSADATLIGLMDQYKKAHDDLKKCQEIKDSIKSQVLIVAKDAEKILGNNFSISMGVIAPALIKEHTRAGYRNFRPFFKKEKPK